jgi:16S rRNA (cytosine967-C5)-methyltransferase
LIYFQTLKQFQKQHNLNYTKSPVRAAAAAVGAILGKGDYADRAIEYGLNENRHWNPAEKSMFVTLTYELVRWLRLLLEIDPCPTTRGKYMYALGVYMTLKGMPPDSEEFPEPFDAEKIKERFVALSAERSVKESIPEWLDEIGSRELGEAWPPLLSALNMPASIILRTNTLKTTPVALQSSLENAGIRSLPVAGVENALLLPEFYNVFTLSLFHNGYFEVQDNGSQMIAPFVDAKPGMRVIDTCAGTGGKTLHLAALMQNKGRIIALDTAIWKLDSLKQRATRAGVTIVETKPIETTKVIKRLAGTADRVLIDAPCSGLGVLRRNPDAKWRLTAGKIQKLIGEQKEILDSYHRMVKPGGMLIYATCSILPSENRLQVDNFLASHPEFTLVEDKILGPDTTNSDGFYMARMVKKDELKTKN